MGGQYEPNGLGLDFTQLRVPYNPPLRLFAIVQLIPNSSRAAATAN